jgi:DNA repair exonuclease SbcCD ATPase subunit
MSNLLIKDEKHTANAVAYAIELTHPAKVGEEPEIKKRLEAEVQPSITIEQIQEKLQRAEEKRNLKKKAMTEEIENKLTRVNERKASLEQAHAERIQIKVERDNSNAEQKRSSAIDSMKKKLNAHNSKVDHVRTHMSSAEKKRIEDKKERLANRLSAAQQKRELRLEQVKNVAILSAQKKIIVDGQNLAPAPVEHII